MHDLLNMVSRYNTSSTRPRRPIGVVVVVDNLTVSLLFVVRIRDFRSWPDGFIMVSVELGKQERERVKAKFNPWPWSIG